MTRCALVLATTLILLTPHASASDTLIPIQQLFDGMREHNGAAITAQFTDTATLQRAQQDGSLRTTDIAEFARAVSQSKSYLDEHLLAVDIQQSGNLASVWTPYVFYRDSTLSHCGVNSFQLVETATGWKIHSLIDNVHTGDCMEFIERHKDKPNIGP